MKTKLFLLVSVIGASLTTYSQENEIPDSGNVGIGTTEPTEKLDVRGGVRIDSTLHVGDSLIIINGARVGDDLTVSGDAYFKNSAYVAKDLKVEEQASFNGPFSTNNAVNMNNLPLSTATPGDYKLLLIDDQGVVKSGELTTEFAEYLYNLAPKHCVTDQNGNTLHPTWDNDVNKIFIECPNTNVGIGTSNTTHKLTVVGDEYVNGTSQNTMAVAVGTTPSTFSRVKINNTTNNPNNNYGAGIEIVGANSLYNKFLLFHTANPTSEIIKVVDDQTGNIPFYLTAGGQMIVNNGTTKTLQLDPDGLLRARKVKVDVQSWPDYVFDSSYVLMPLSELQNYIDEENHLPNVPSATELETEGSDLYEMSKIQMAKIEELTLYLLQQQKKIEELEQKVIELELKNN